MSTKATRATLQIVTERLEDNLAEEGLSRAQRESYEHQLELARESLAEVEAIERAAVVLRDSTKAKEVIAAQALLFKIAEDAP
jgi:hypothetical protein